MARGKERVRGRERETERERRRLAHLEWHPAWLGMDGDGDRDSDSDSAWNLESDSFTDSAGQQNTNITRRRGAFDPR